MSSVHEIFIKMGQLVGGYRSVSTSNDELEVPQKFDNSPSRKIRMYLSHLKKSSADILIQVEGCKSETQICNDNPLQQRNNINTISKTEVMLFSFGPYFSKEFSSNSLNNIKNQAYEHVLEKTSPGDTSKAKDVYMSIIREVINDQVNHYADGIQDLSQRDFRLMMLKDACLFLQLSLMLILESPKPLGYVTSAAFFGEKPNKKDQKMCVESMFLVGNQIPLVVLKKLLDQTFFQSVLKKGKVDHLHQFSLCKKVLHDLLFLSSTKGQKGSSITEDDQQPPFDILHGLYNHVIGSPLKQLSFGLPEPKYDIDLEANSEISASESILDELINRPYSAADGTGDETRTFSCATDLKSSFIYVKLNKSGGVRSISFNSYYIMAYLYLPALLIDDHTEIMFRNLIAYETSHQPPGTNNHRGEVSSYIQLMSDVIRTARDVKLLKDSDIIQFRGTINPNYDDELPKMLRRLSNQGTPLAHNFQLLSHKIRNYSGPPWNRIKNILNVVVVLAFLQTVLTLVAYIHPRSG